MGWFVTFKEFSQVAGSSRVEAVSLLSLLGIETQKRFERTPFIRTKHNMQIPGVVPLSTLKMTSKQQLKGKR